MQTPRVPVSWACAPAAKAPASSWRTPTQSMRSSRRIASVTGLRASPTTPQTVRTPWSARDAISSSATVVMVFLWDASGSGGEAVRVGQCPVERPRLGWLGEELAVFEVLEQLGVALR